MIIEDDFINQSRPFNSKYSLATMRRSIQLVMFGLSSLRGAVRCLNIFSDSSKDKIPSHTTIQNWILRYGLYTLQKVKEHRDDWIYILDFTIEFGSQKCLVILGITLERLRNIDFEVTRQDVTVLKIVVCSRSNGEMICDILKDLAKETDSPKQLVSDHGSDLKKGIELYCQNSERTIYSYDITHKMAILLKHILENDKKWQEFVKQCADCKRKTVQSNLGFLAPPKPREKSRYQNLDKFVDWAEKVLNCDKNKINVDCEKFVEYFGWLNDFQKELKEWRKFLEIIRIGKHEVKKYGLNRENANHFRKEVIKLNGRSKRAKQLIGDIFDFLHEQSKSISKGESLLGTSDIIESIFGKYKNFSARTAMKGVGKLLLTIPTFTSHLSLELIKKATESTSIQDLTNWINEIIGKSFFSKRKNALVTIK